MVFLVPAYFQFAVNFRLFRLLRSFQVRYSPLVSVLSPESKEEQMVIVENNTAVITDLLKYTQYQVGRQSYSCFTFVVV